MRCTACNRPLKDNEMIAKNPITKQYEDMCRVCINAVYSIPFLPEPEYIPTPLLDGLPYGPKTRD